MYTHKHTHTHTFTYAYLYMYSSIYTHIYTVFTAIIDYGYSSNRVFINY